MMRILNRLLIRGSGPAQTARLATPTPQPKETPMEVETYEVTETTSAGPECDAESLKLIEQLGLTAQMDRITAPAGDKSINPYRLMTRQEEQVYKLLMPKVCELKQYADGPVPLRVLQVAAHAADHFDFLAVWCPETGPKDDPLLIGQNNHPSYRTSFSMGRENFILARWGDCLLPFEKMTEKAAKIARARVADKINQMSNELRAAIDSLPTMSDERALKLAITPPSIFNLD
jgi:hypothetical protein